MAQNHDIVRFSGIGDQILARAGGTELASLSGIVSPTSVGDTMVENAGGLVVQDLDCRRLWSNT